jgi:hypothetical protein
VPPPAGFTVAQAGDVYHIAFDVDNSVANTFPNNVFTGIYPGAVKNIVYTVPARGITITPPNTGFTDNYNTVNLYSEYRWDVQVVPDVIMIFWLRSHTTVFTDRAIPNTIDPFAFEFLHEVAFYRPSFSNGTIMSGPITSVPEPAGVLVVACAMKVVRRRRRRRAR